jgi:hypothetical protein
MLAAAAIGAAELPARSARRLLLAKAPLLSPVTAELLTARVGIEEESEVATGGSASLDGARGGGVD